MKFSQICLILPKNRSSASEDRTIIPLFSLQQTIYTKPACMRKLIFSSLFILSLFLFISQQVTFARSGCCSHHGGVCGCGCCDGSSLSAICAPYYPQCGSTGGSALHNTQVSQGVASVTLRLTITSSPTIMPSPTRKPTLQPTSTSVPVHNQIHQATPQSQSFWTMLLKFFHLI